MPVPNDRFDYLFQMFERSRLFEETLDRLGIGINDEFLLCRGRQEQIGDGL
jgi:hypothetical protein